jgi:hypothetical protein
VIGWGSIALQVSAYGQTNSWINSAAGKWEDASSWSLGTAPGSSDAADLITNATSITVTNDATTAGSFPDTMVISNLTVSAPSGSTNTLVLSNIGTNTPLIVHNSVMIGPGAVLLMTNSLLSLDGATDGAFSLDSIAILYDCVLLLNTNVAMTVGTVGNGTLLAAGGSNTLSGDIYVGYSTNSIGSVLLAAGQLVMSNGNVAIGFYSSGQVTMSNRMLMFGSMSVSVSNGLPNCYASLATGLLLGATASSSGELNISGGTCLDNGHLGLGEESGSTGLVWVCGGQLILTNDYFTGIGENGAGLMVVSNGQVLAGICVVGSGSSSQGALTISGGSTTFTGPLAVGAGYGATGVVSITGGQLAVTNQYILVGSSGVGQMTVSNGVLLARTMNVGHERSSQGTLAIAGGTVSVASNLVVGVYSNATGTIQIFGGTLGVTNQTGTGQLVVGQRGQGTFIQSGGATTVDQLLAVSGANSVLTFNSGTLSSRGTTISNAQTFAVGDGINAATYQLLGGVHSFADGLRVRTNAVVTGCGTINGAVVVDPGGTITSACGAGTTLTFTGIVTNNGVLRAVNGSTLEFYGLVVNNGLINAFAGNTNFHAGLVNNGAVLTSNSLPQIVSFSVAGSDVNIQFTTFSNLTHYVEYNSDLVNGSWIALTGFTGTGGIMSHTDPGAAILTQRFYRVHLVVPQ